MKKRFVAEWISYQSPDDGANCIYESCFASSLSQAKRSAVIHSKQCNVVEWVAAKVEIETLPGYWETIERYVGDWTGFWQQVI